MASFILSSCRSLCCDSPSVLGLPDLSRDCFWFVEPYNEVLFAFISPKCSCFSLRHSKEWSGLFLFNALVCYVWGCSIPTRHRCHQVQSNQQKPRELAVMGAQGNTKQHLKNMNKKGLILFSGPLALDCAGGLSAHTLVGHWQLRLVVCLCLTLRPPFLLAGYPSLQLANSSVQVCRENGWD